MIRPASPHELPTIRDLFARGNDAPYDLAAVAEEKCFGPGISGRPAVRVFERGGRIAGIAVTCGKWLRILAVDRHARRQGVGTALLDDAEARGARVIAAEPGNHFIPGVWMRDEGTRAFFHARGYVEKQPTWNMHVDLGVIDMSRMLHEGPRIHRATLEETNRVLEFIEAEFGAVWRFEAWKAFDRDVPAIFVAEEGGAITGFAAHDLNNHGLGFFGPTGVAKSMRGRGIGCRLLLASLADLRHLGYERAVIPWTDALDFYRKCCGAEPAHRFVAFAKPSAIDSAA